MSWNQHCDDQHWSAVVGLLQLRWGALQVWLKKPEAFGRPASWPLPCFSPALLFVRRPNTYHSNLQVSWDLNTGVCCTVGVGDLTEVRGQTRWGKDPYFVCLSLICSCCSEGVYLSCQWKCVEFLQEVLCKHGDEVVSSWEQLTLHQSHDQWSFTQRWVIEEKINNSCHRSVCIHKYMCIYMLTRGTSSDCVFCCLSQPEIVTQCLKTSRRGSDSNSFDCKSKILFNCVKAEAWLWNLVGGQ